MRIEEEIEIRKIAIKLADGFCKSKNSNLKKLDESKFDNLFKIYDSLKSRLKNAMRDTKKIDRHKISSLIVISILQINPFEIDNENKKTAKDRNVTYMLALQTALAVLNAFSENKQYEFRLDKKYFKEIVRLLHSNYSLLMSIYGSCEGEDKNINIVFFISHLFYWIERDCISKELKQNK